MTNEQTEPNLAVDYTITMSDMVKQLEAQEAVLIKSIARESGIEQTAAKNLVGLRKDLRDTKRMLKAAKPATKAEK